MKVVIIGAGEVGFHIAKALYSLNDVIVIDQNEAACRRADDELDVHVIKGNGANVSILSEVLKDTDILMAVTGSDEINIVACLASKLIVGDNSKLKTLARVSNPDYIDKPIEKRPSIGIDVMICPELSMASQVAQILSIPFAIDTDSFAGGKVEMMEIVISKDNYFANKKLRDLQFTDSCIVSAIFRNNDIIIPNGNDVIQEHDHIVIIGKSSAMKDIRNILGEITGRRSNIMIIGGGTVGFYLAKIISNISANIKIIESNESRSKYIADEVPNALVLLGDGTDIHLLKDEDIDIMDVVVSVTDSDEKNLLCSLIAKKLGVKKVIARADRSEYMSLFEMVGVDSAVSPMESTVNEVLKLTMGKSIESITTIEGQKAGILEYTVSEKSSLVGKKIKDIKFPPNAIISMIVHEGETIIPSGTYVISKHDRVVVFTLPSSISKLEQLFK